MAEDDIKANVKQLRGAIIDGRKQGTGEGSNRDDLKNNFSGDKNYEKVQDETLLETGCVEHGSCAKDTAFQRSLSIHANAKCSFAFDDLSFKLPATRKTGPKTIISGLTGKLTSGAIMAVRVKFDFVCRQFSYFI